MPGPGDSEVEAWAAVEVTVVPARRSLGRYVRYLRANELLVPAVVIGLVTVVQAFRVSWQFVVMTWLVVTVAAWLFAKLVLWRARRKLSRRSAMQFRATEVHVKGFGFPSRKEPAWAYDCLAVPVPGGLEVAARGQIGLRGTLHGVLSSPEWAVTVEVDPHGRLHSVKLIRDGRTFLEAPALGRMPDWLDERL